MKQISMMIKPASSSCNLRCKYCFYADVSSHREIITHGIMKEETAARLCARVNEALAGKGRANISFQGGEPTLAGLSWFRHFVSTMKTYPGIETVYALQTNGTLLNEEWADFFAENRFLIGVSLDGYQSNMDMFRMDAENSSVYFTILKNIDLLRKKKVEFNILTVVTKNLAAHPEGLLKYYFSHDMHFIQLIPCLPSFENDKDPFALTPKEYADFFIRFFDGWVKETAKGNYMSVNLFDNLYEMINGRYPYQCGMIGRCSQQFVIEANGDVYPCDFYCLDEYLLGNIKESSFEQLALQPPAKELLTSEYKKKPCRTCRYVNLCHGGCRRQNVCYVDDDACAYEKVLDHVIPILSRMQ